MARSVASQSPQRHRDQLVLDHLALADTIGGCFHRQYSGLIERDDAQQVARLELVRAVSRLDAAHDNPVPYLRHCIQGALSHYLRDRSRLVRVSRRQHELGTHAYGHTSLDAPLGGQPTMLLDQLAAPDTAPTDPQLAATLDTLVDQLPAAQAASLRLTVLEGLSLRQAAAQLGLSPMTVCRARKKALATLREQVTA
ncbi:sigma-70 family RNA polymerase sigma factor [Cyanobium sp. ATX 6F1]|uniref:sigma-70 family RNA polymerase sigma factor n=1 Tax=unclassified Cyanobium TaxID=2627006 RepID=UPI0020CE6696|nr:sigma-70 family RNA polymerase sigma factor [Cyanobium sp. ATX 6F1]MCP9916237.1 sigma-70 family RNA polymerase sigma factor [Cyanobium sp. ATX 6F1]